MKFFSKNKELIKKYFYPLFWVLVVLLLVLKFALTTNTGSNEEFLRTYKFIPSDGYDWIANGILLFKSEIISFRNPALPLLIKLLYSTNTLFFLPLINQLVFGGIVFYIFLIVKRVFKSGLAAYIVVVFMFLNYSLQNFANYILADYYSVFFITASVYYLLRNRFKTSLFLLGASMLFQNFAFFLAPLWFVYVIINEVEGETIREKAGNVLMYLRKNSLKLIGYFFLLFHLNLLWFLYKYLLFGNPLYTGVQQIELLSPNLNSTLFYIVNAYTLFGPVFYIVCFFLILRLKKYWKSWKILLLIGASLITIVFWCIFYEWDDRRFLLYLLPFFYSLFGYVLSKFIFKLNNFLVISILVFALYSTTISINSAFTNNIVPITNWNHISFTTSVDENTGASSISFPIKYEQIEFPLIAVANPTYAQLFHNSNSYRFDVETQYSTYVNIIEESYEPSTNSICIPKNVDYYSFNSIFLIQEGKSLREIPIKCDK